MNLKLRLAVVVIAVAASGIYVKFFSAPAEKKANAKLVAGGGTNEVVASLGQPFRVVDAATFSKQADDMANKGTPVSNANTKPKGMVWLYADRGIKHTDVRYYRTVFFDESNRVASISRTYWAKDPWNAKM